MAVRLDYPEGATPLDPNELGGLKHRHVTTQGELDELEQANIASGLRWLARMRRKDILTDEFAIELHRRLFGEVWSWAGSFRKTGKNIGVDPARIGIELRAVMDDARYWADHGTYLPAEMAVRLHHRIVRVHPFANGNGRHARILADVVLDRIYGAGPINWTAGADLQRMNQRRAAYIAALKAADNHEIAPLLAFVGRKAEGGLLNQSVLLNGTAEVLEGRELIYHRWLGKAETERGPSKNGHLPLERGSCRLVGTGSNALAFRDEGQRSAG